MKAICDKWDNDGLTKISPSPSIKCELGMEIWPLFSCFLILDGSLMFRYGFGKEPKHWRVTRFNPVFTCVEDIIKFLQKSECLYREDDPSLESNPFVAIILMAKCCLGGKVLYCTYDSKVDDFCKFFQKSSPEQIATLQVLEGLIIKLCSCTNHL